MAQTAGSPASAMDYASLELLRRTHPAWRLLQADHAPLVMGFLHAAFIVPNVRSLSRHEMVAQLDDALYALREQLGAGALPKPAAEYLDAWAADDKGWLRKYYPAGSDEPSYDLTPATEKAIDWVLGLKQRQLVATESRLLTVFELLRQLTEGTETDPETQIADLERRKARLEAEIRRVREGRLELMDEARIKDRFLAMAATARALLSDFREVDQSFRDLDRSVREQIAGWESGKGALLGEIFGEHDAIGASDQGKTFRAFWDFLMSPARQEELAARLERVLALPAVKALEPDPRLGRIHHDWLSAGEVTQRTIARLSAQLRRFLDEQGSAENRRIAQLVRQIEQHALALRESPPGGPVAAIDDAAPEVSLPMERPLFAPPFKPRIADEVLLAGSGDIPAEALFDQVFVDKARLKANVVRSLQARAQVSLAEIVRAHPLEHGLAELLAYLAIATEGRDAVIDGDRTQVVDWSDGEGVRRRATVPIVIFGRAAPGERRT